MVESLTYPRPSTRPRLQLESLEDRWSLGGAGFLGASFGFGDDLPTSFGKDENFSVDTAAVRITPIPSSSTSQLAAGSFTGADDQQSADQGDRGSAVLIQGGTGNTIGGFVVAAEPASSSRNQDGFSLLDSSSSDISIRSNLAGTSEEGTTAHSDAGAGPSVRANFVSGNAASTSETAIAHEGVGTGVIDPNKLADTISFDPSSITDGGSAGKLITGGVSTSIRSVPVAQPPIAANVNGPNVARITAQNRNTVTMMGGWNPALRSIMVMNDGSRWFAAEQGTNIEVNSAIVYYRLGPVGWKKAGSVMLPAGIQQNMATITNGRMIYSYGCARGSVIEAWFDTAKPRWNLVSGNALSASGRVVNPGAESNYIGAAWHNKTRIVWWTTVGKSGSGGNWTYSYNSGGGWNGPIVSGLGGYNEVGYVRAQFDERSRIRMIGESYRGHFPNGVRLLSSTTVKLGNAAKWAPLLTNVARSPLDLWQEDSSGATQYLYETSRGKVGYSSGPRVADSATNFAAIQARFIVSRDRLGLVLGFKNSVEVRIIPRSEATGFIDWNAIQPIRFDLPTALKSAGMSAIWNVDGSKQPHESDRLEFAICGAYPAHDNLIYYFKID